MRYGYYTMTFKVDNLSNSVIKVILFSPKGTDAQVLINGDKVYEATSNVGIGVDFPSIFLAISGWTGAKMADLS